MYITNFTNLVLTFFEKLNRSFPPLEEREGGPNPLKYADPSGELYYLKQATSGTPDYRASRDYSNYIRKGNYGDIIGGGGGAGYSYSSGTCYYYDSAGNIVNFDEIYNSQILPNGITIYGGIDPTSIRFGKSHGVSGVWYQTTSVSSQTRIGDVGSSNFNATFNIGVVSTFTATGQGGTPWMTAAEGQLGVTEIAGSKHNPSVIDYHATTGGFKDDETPWCSSFVNWSIKQAGIKGTNSARALSWNGWGQSLDNPAYGSIAIIDYGGGKGHVGFVAGVNSSGSIILLGGNQSNMVRYSAFSPSSISGYAYPSGYSPSYTLPTLIINKAGGFGSTR
ncbi:MAG: TIGR02594 family protein [Prolixibacteraceae bacterium]|jgi:uncharacterized protein (TIGR02594 family)|nr:TIGR02594 family protein [Prolixibacteraceae bacterium]